MKISTSLRQWYQNRDDKNLYSRFGAVSLKKAVPLGLQHVLVMFLANITPILVVFSLFSDSGLTQDAIRSAILMSGVGTLIQIFPVWKFGSGLPVLLGVSVTFMGACSLIATHYDYETMMGSLLVGGIFLTVFGLLAPYWRKAIKPVVSAIVVISIGLALISLSARQFFSLSEVTSLNVNGLYSFDKAWPFLTISTVTLLASLTWSTFTKGHLRNLYILIGFVFGYITSIIMHYCFPELGILDFNYNFTGQVRDIISIPRFIDLGKLKFDPGAILFMIVVYIVVSTEGVGDLFAITHGALGRSPRQKEIAGGLACDGLVSILACLFGSLPLTVSSQNVGVVVESKITNKFTIAIGAIFLIIISLFPPVAVFLETIPSAVLGGCTLLLFGSIFITGISMFQKVGLTRKNTLILCLSLGLGYGVSLLGESFFNTEFTFQGNFVYLYIILENAEVNMFAIAFLLSYIIPDSNNDKTIDREKAEILMNEVKEEKLNISEQLLKDDIKKDLVVVKRTHTKGPNTHGTHEEIK